MNIDETRIALEQARSYDSRTITDAMVADWQRALTRTTFEESFDAVHTHFETCGPRLPLVAGHILEHVTKARHDRLDVERRQRDQERNEAVFGELADKRSDWEREVALEAMHAGRARLDAVLAARKLEREAS